MKMQPFGQAALVLSMLAGCTNGQQCGTWAFSGSTFGNPFQSSITSTFTFNPADCGKMCNAQTVATIQMVRVYDVTNGTFIYPSSSYNARENPYGWSIDQSDGWAYAYYGLNNDGATFDSTFNVVGSNGTADTLSDGPHGQPDNSEFWATDVAVCFKSATCQNKIAGIYFWGFSVDTKGNASAVTNLPSWTGLEGEFQSTVSAWNAWAPSSGTEDENTGPNPVSGQPTLSSAVALPALSDL